MVAIFQVHQCMVFLFHNSYVILGLVHNTVIFLKELRCGHKGYTNKITLSVGLSFRYKDYTIIITNWLTVTKYPSSMDVFPLIYIV